MKKEPISAEQLRLSILLMEHDPDFGYVINCRRLHTELAIKQPFQGKTYATMSRFIEKQLITPEQTHIVLKQMQKDYDIFAFLRSEAYFNINYECVFIIKENLKFLEEIYGLLREHLPDPERVLADPLEFDRFVETSRGLALNLELIPNLCTLKEWLVLILDIRRQQKILEESQVEDFNLKGKQTPDKILDFEEFKILVLLFAKFLFVKFSNLFPLLEETYLQQLLWYMFLKAVNNPKFGLDGSQKKLNYKLENNVLSQLAQTRQRPDHLAEEGLREHLTTLFLLFANNFSRVGHPHLLLDSNKLLRHPRFARDAGWIAACVNSHDSDFKTFLEVLKRLLNLAKGSEEYRVEISDFLKHDGFTHTFRIRSYVDDLPFLDEKLLVKIKRSFGKYSTDDEHLHVMDFLFLCQHSQIVPSIFTNRQIMTLFYYFNLRSAQREGLAIAQVFHPDHFYYVDFIDFIRLLIEISNALIGGTIKISNEDKLKMLFKRFFK